MLEQCLTEAFIECKPCFVDTGFKGPLWQYSGPRDGERRGGNASCSSPTTKIRGEGGVTSLSSNWCTQCTDSR